MQGSPRKMENKVSDHVAEKAQDTESTQLLPENCVGNYKKLYFAKYFLGTLYVRIWNFTEKFL